MDSGDEDLVLTILSEKKKRRFGVRLHPLLQSRARESFTSLSKKLEQGRGCFRAYFRTTLGQFVLFNLRLVCQTTLGAERHR